MPKVVEKSKCPAKDDICLIVTTPNGLVTLSSESIRRTLVILDTLQTIGVTRDNTLSQPYTYSIPSSDSSELKRSA
jgi:hypothetical protein